MRTRQAVRVMTVAAAIGIVAMLVIGPALAGGMDDTGGGPGSCPPPPPPHESTTLSASTTSWSLAGVARLLAWRLSLILLVRR